MLTVSASRFDPSAMNGSAATRARSRSATAAAPPGAAPPPGPGAHVVSGMMTANSSPP